MNRLFAGDQTDHGSNVNAGGPVSDHFVGLGSPVGSGDVHVCPRDLFGIIVIAAVWDELLEEGCGRVGTPVASGSEVSGVGNL